MLLGFGLCFFLLSDFWFWFLDFALHFGCQIWDFGFQILDFGLWIWVLVVGIFDFVFQILDFGFWMFGFCILALILIFWTGGIGGLDFGFSKVFFLQDLFYCVFFWQCTQCLDITNCKLL